MVRRSSSEETPERPPRKERRGGRREGAGRPPNGERAGVSHLRRARLRARQPVHVTVQMAPGLPTLRAKPTWEVVRGAFVAAADRNGLTIVEFSVQSDHLHILAEPLDAEGLSRGMQGLQVRLARGLNRLWERRGTVFAERYDVVKLTTPAQVREALASVLNNARRHGHGKAEAGWVDPYSTAPWFASYLDHPPRRVDAPPAAKARSWLLTAGWMEPSGRFTPDYVPEFRGESRIA